jgi:CDGSH-type Zn-finger protein/truncated hemoglobin YjbI
MKTGAPRKEKLMPAIRPDLKPLLEAAGDLATRLGQSADERTQRARARLQDSVVRPLRQAVQVAAAAETPPGDRGIGPAGGLGDAGTNGKASTAGQGDQLWELARAATRLRTQYPDVPELAEATAALQDLAIGSAGQGAAESRLAELAALQAGLDPGIQAMADGPYLVTGARALIDWLGQPLPVRPQLALCRCGGSKIKPLCDGTHAAIGFRTAKDPGRVPDRRDTYPGQQVTVLDNRGTCQHSGLCTSRLAAVFRQGQEPFVAPSGGRMDEIIRAVRDCPSGALSYGIDAAEAREDADWHGKREPVIEVTRDGPYRITGGIPLTDGHGTDEHRNAGASREHYALCRCGHSQNKPFCSGMHWYVEFRDPVPDPDREPTVFEWAGGLPALTRMTRIFYEKHVPADPLLAPLFATMSPDHPQRVAKWLGEVFGGPNRYSAEYGGYPRMISQHLGKQITEQMRVRWVTLLGQAAAEAGLPNDPEFRSVLGSYIEWGTRLAVENSQRGARPPEHMPMPRWDWRTAAGPPGSRISALAPPGQDDEPEPALPAAGEPVRFADNIKALFRRRDRQSMQFAFDLWSCEDVSKHAQAILGRLRSGTMPCDGAWPDEKIEVFQRWIDAGKPA